MSTLNQVSKKFRKKKKKQGRSKALKGCPQRKGICLRVGTMKPKKPNSAIRKIAFVRLLNKGKSVLSYIPGSGHTLQKFSTVLVRGGRVKDLPGVLYHLIKGKYDFTAGEVFRRGKARSKYGLKMVRQRYKILKA